MEKISHTEPKEKYRIISNPYERMHYVHLTDELIAKLDGSQEELYDAVIFLDSSARPVEWLMKHLWNYSAATNKNGKVPTMPSRLFLNIDARRSNGEIKELRELFLDSSGTDLTIGKRILVVDEIAVSGDTIKTAESVLKEALPDAHINTFVWMDERNNTRGGAPQNNPRWYERSDSPGANNRYRAVLGRQNSWLAEVNPDSAGSVDLRQEMKNIAIDVEKGNLPYWPAESRDDSEDRIYKSTGLSIADFASLRGWMKEHYAPKHQIASSQSDKTGPLSDREARRFLDGSPLIRMGELATKLAISLGFK